MLPWEKSLKNFPTFDPLSIGLNPLPFYPDILFSRDIRIRLTENFSMNLSLIPS
jgi:hypothetical protein